MAEAFLQRAFQGEAQLRDRQRRIVVAGGLRGRALEGVVVVGGHDATLTGAVAVAKTWATSVAERAPPARVRASWCSPQTRLRTTQRTMTCPLIRRASAIWLAAVITRRSVPG